MTPNNMKTENYDGIITWNRTSGSSGLEVLWLVIFLGSAVIMLFGEPARSLAVSVQHIEQGGSSINKVLLLAYSYFCLPVCVVLYCVSEGTCSYICVCVMIAILNSNNNKSISVLQNLVQKCYSEHKSETERGPERSCRINTQGS